MSGVLECIGGTPSSGYTGIYSKENNHEALVKGLVYVVAGILTNALPHADREPEILTAGKQIMAKSCSITTTEKAHYHIYDTKSGKTYPAFIGSLIGWQYAYLQVVK